MASYDEKELNRTAGYWKFAGKVIVYIWLLMVFSLWWAAILDAQTIPIQPGETLTLTIVADTAPVRVDSIPFPVPGPTVTDTVYECPPEFTRTDDNESWTCGAPVELDTLPPLVMIRPDLSIEGDSLIVTLTPNPSPDSRGIHTISYRVRGGNNTSGANLPFVTVTGTRHAWKLPLPGEYWVCTAPQNAAGEPQSSCRGILYAPVISSLDVKIETCLAFMRERQEGIYYSPAADACMKLGSITDRVEVNRIHAEYWRSRGLAVHDDPFPGTVTTLEVLPQA